MRRLRAAVASADGLIRLFHPSCARLARDRERRVRLHGDVLGEDGSKCSSSSTLQQSVIGLVRQQTMGPATDTIAQLIGEAKSDRELKRTLDELVMTHPFAFDTLNGHGFRVIVFKKLSFVCAKLGEITLWWETMLAFRAMGFNLSRQFIAAALDTMKKVVRNRFAIEGRNPDIAVTILAKCRQLQHLSGEDGVPYDWLLYTRTLFVITSVVSIFDRQNLFRTHFTGTLAAREGLVPDWVVTPTRTLDYDNVVRQCDAQIHELLSDIRLRAKSRPPFSFMHRLMTYYFSSDNLDSMIATMEDCRELGVSIAESSTAKAMQLICAFNHPQAMRLFFEWRVSVSWSLLAPPDISRLLFYYCRSGGGESCPHCGDKSNHRNVGLTYWEQSPAEVKNCPLLELARVRKGELSDHPGLPQNKDWSHEAFLLFEMSEKRGIIWTLMEWRGFLLCCTFSPRALEALSLLKKHLPRAEWDDFLQHEVMRVLRHHRPERVRRELEQAQALKGRVTPYALQEAMIGACQISNEAERIDCLRYVLDSALRNSTFCTPYAKRCIQAVLARREVRSTSEEGMLASKILALEPGDESVRMAPIQKDSVVDIIPAGSKRNQQYLPHSSAQPTRRPERKDTSSVIASATAKSKAALDPSKRWTLGKK